MRLSSKHAAWLIPALLLAAGVALFAAQLVSLARHRLDYPIVDDWRYYMDGYAMPPQLTLAWLLHPAADTLHVTGKLADWLFFRGVSHDYSRLAVASFGLCAGGWLLCAAWVCLRAGRGRPALVAWSLLALAVPLATVPYFAAISPQQWLEPAIAYHQMLPVPGLFLLGALGLRGRGAAARPSMLALVALLTLAFSLAYSSGALALLVFGAVLGAGSWLHRWRHGGDSGPLLGFGVTVAAVAGLCLLAHIAVPWWEVGKNPVTQTRSGSPTPPWRGLFWHFLFGLFDRAVLSTDTGRLAFFRGMGVALAVVTPPLLLAVVLWRRVMEPRAREACIVLSAIVLAVVSYAVLVSYGRAEFGSDYFPRLYPPAQRASLYAHSRFFYWWIAAVLPLTALSSGLLAENLCSRRAGTWVAAMLVIAALWPKGRDPERDTSYFDHWSYAEHYASDATRLRKTIASFDRVENIRNVLRLRMEGWSDLPLDLRNPVYFPAALIWPQGDRREIFATAERAGATFVARWELLLDPDAPER